MPRPEERESRNLQKFFATQVLFASDFATNEAHTKSKNLKLSKEEKSKAGRTIIDREEIVTSRRNWLRGSWGPS